MLSDVGGVLSLGTNLAARLARDDLTYHNWQINTITYAGVRLANDGTQYYKGPGDTWAADLDSGKNPWLVQGSAGDFWVRATLNSSTSGLNDTTSGVDSWLQLNTTRSWSIVDSVAGIPTTAEEASLTLEIATDSGGSNIVATETYTLRAFNDNAV